MKKYQIIYADPPWQYENYNYSKTKHGSKAKRGVVKEYPVMNINDIKKLPIKNICDTNCTLFIWVTFPLLIEGIETITKWGFRYKTCAFVWVKSNKRTDMTQTSFLPQDNFDSFWGMGNWTRSNAEICLLGIKGKPQRLNADVHQLIYAPIGKHSKKPNETRNRIVRLCGDIPRIELFARNATEGWDIWGNEVDSTVNISDTKAI